MRAIRRNKIRLHPLGWLAVLLVALLVIGGCPGIGLLTYLPLFDLVNPNIITGSQGKIELLASAGQGLDFGVLSPDGQRMALRPLPSTQTQSLDKLGNPLFIWNITAGTRTMINIPMAEMRWLNADQLAILIYRGCINKLLNRQWVCRVQKSPNDCDILHK